MENQINYQVSLREEVYYFIKIIISIALYLIIINFILDEFIYHSLIPTYKHVITFYVIIFIVYLFLRLGLLIGYIKGNAIKVSKEQFPDLYNILENQATLLELKKIPDLYILQSGGLLNAFATRFIGRNYIVLYSEIVETAYAQDKNILEFIIGHELGHIKRDHLIKRFLLFPSIIIPFLESAYLRACEYTCDNIGFALAPKGLKGGLLVLASGPTIYKKVNINAYLNQNKNKISFWKWFSEKISSHPHLSKRLAVFENEISMVKEEQKVNVWEQESDHSKYMPH